MSLRPFRDINRRKTKVINVGNIKIGGDNPISVQSMTNTLTTDIKSTINQINDISAEGADIVRVSCPDKDSALALKEITEQQIAVFMDASSSLELREEAHDIICALSKIDDYFDSVNTDEVMYNHKQNKGESAP